MNKTDLINERRLTKLQDLVTSLERLQYYDEAEELQELLLNPKATAQYIIDKFRNKFENIIKDLDCDWMDYRDEDWNKYESDFKEFQKILDIETNIDVGYKDIVKYDEVYLFYDNVLSRRMVRWHQRLGLSNIEKDGCPNWFRSQQYIKRWTGVIEKITWMPRVQEFTLIEYQRMLDKGWIDIEREEVLLNTEKRNIIHPDMIEIEWMIEDAKEFFEYDNEWEKETFKKKIDEEKEDKEMIELRKKMDEHDNELIILKNKMEKQNEELRRLAWL